MLMYIPPPGAGPPAGAQPPPFVPKPLWIATLQELLAQNQTLNQLIQEESKDLAALEGRVREINKETEGDSEEKKKVDAQSKRVSFRPEGQAALDRRLEIDSHLAELTKEKHALSQNIAKLKARLETNLAEKNKLIEKAAIRCYQEDELPPVDDELYSKIASKLMNHLVLDFENKSQVIHSLIEQRLSRPALSKDAAQVEIESKEVEKLVDLEKQRDKIVGRVFKLQRNISEQLADHALVTYRDLMARSPHLTVRLLARVDVNVADAAARFLIEHLEPKELLEVIRMIIRNDSEKEMIRLLGSASKKPSLIREDSLTDKLVVLYQKNALEPINKKNEREPILAKAFNEIKKICRTNLEIDPHQLVDPTKEVNIEAIHQQQNKYKMSLLAALKLIRNDLKDNRKKISPEMKEIYHFFYENIQRMLPGNEESQLASFFILRYFAPLLALSSALLEESKNLRLLSRGLQTMATQEVPSQPFMKFLFQLEKPGEQPFNQQVLPLIQEIVSLLRGEKIE